MIKARLWFRQKLMNTLHWFLLRSYNGDDEGRFTERLRLWSSRTLDAQMADRKKLGIIEIESHVVWESFE